MLSYVPIYYLILFNVCKLYFEHALCSRIHLLNLKCAINKWFDIPNILVIINKLLTKIWAMLWGCFKPRNSFFKFFIVEGVKELVSVSSNTKSDSHARLPLVSPCLGPDGGYGAAFPASTAVLKEARSPSQHLDEVVCRRVQPLG